MADIVIPGSLTKRLKQFVALLAFAYDSVLGKVVAGLLKLVIGIVGIIKQ